MAHIGCKNAKMPGFAWRNWRNEKMKMVFVLFDSLVKKAMGCYGGTHIRTPNFERLGLIHACFLCCGLCITFMAFLGSKTKNMPAHKFLLPIDSKKQKKLWKFDILAYPAFALAFKIFFAFFKIFLTFWHLLYLILVKFGSILWTFHLKYFFQGQALAIF